MKRLLIPIAVVAVAAVVVVAVAAGGSGGGGGSAQGASSKGAAGGDVIALRSTPLGRILVDAGGRTLYLFEADKPGKSNCSGACLSLWPPVTSAAAAPKAGAGLTARVATIPSAGGGRQVTYNGHPLYLYAGDRKPGDTAGQALDQFGAEWYVLGANGDKVDRD